MGHEVIKLELIEWLTKLEDEETIETLKIVKDAHVMQVDEDNDLTDEQKSGIERGLKDVDFGRVTSPDDVRQQYGL